MVTLSNITWHAPCGIDDKQRLAQFVSRVEGGWTPTIGLKAPLSPDLTAQLAQYVKDYDVKGVMFDLGIGVCKGEDKGRPLFGPRVNYIAARVQQDPDHFSPTVLIKLDSSLNVSREDLDLNAKISGPDHLAALERTVDDLAWIAAYAQDRELRIAVENRPEPNYGYHPEGKLPRPDPEPRWKNAKGQTIWSAVPRFTGSFASNAQEILYILSRVPGVALNLDMEHLSQVAGPGHIFNLENAPEGRLRYGDLTSEQQWGLQNLGLSYREEDVLFDLTDIRDEERDMLASLGYLVREGQPRIYGHRLTLEGEVRRLADAAKAGGLDIELLTPGFQVYQGMLDTRNGQDTLIIGSHLPGITPRYIHDAGLRLKLMREIMPVHALARLLIESAGVRDLEVEIQVDDGEKVVYQGPIWEADAAEARRQTEQNLLVAGEGHTYVQLPYYFSESKTFKLP